MGVVIAIPRLHRHLQVVLLVQTVGSSHSVSSILQSDSPVQG